CDARIACSSASSFRRRRALSPLTGQGDGPACRVMILPTPPGVEHYQPRPWISSMMKVMILPTPPGVEHPLPQSRGRELLAVMILPTPPGVEHCIARAILCSVLRCDDPSDAAWR